MATEGLIDRTRRRLSSLVLRTGMRLQPASSPQRHSAYDSNNAVSSTAIVITTFAARQYRYCLPLVEALRAADQSTPIIVVVNGELPEPIDDASRRRFTRELLAFPQVYPISLRQRVGLARLWNLGIQMADTSVCVMLNDDLTADPDHVWADLDALAREAATNGVGLGAGSWSHFAISRDCIANVGWFEERLLGFGEEDADYTVRFFAAMGRVPQHVPLTALHHLHAADRQTLPAGHGKYSLFNKVFVATKFSAPPNADALQGPQLFARNLRDINQYPGEDFRRRHQRHLLNLTDEQEIRAAIDAITEGEGGDVS